MYRLVFVLVLFQFWAAETVRVCSTLADYPLNKNCYDNEDSSRNITQIIQSWGFTAEEHVVVTEDGYHIGIERLYNNVTKKNPILVGHGIMMNAEGWTTHGNKSMAYVLADAGYDVWLITFRGGKYSITSNKLTAYQYAYWDFSFHEMIIYDFKAASDLVYRVTQKQVIYIGYSMGTQVGLGYGSLFPQDMAKKVTGMALLSPATFYINQKSWAKFLIPFMPLIMAIDKNIFQGRLFYIIPIGAKLCSIGALPMLICHFFTGLIFGPDFEQIDPEYYPLFFTNVPDQVCLKNLNHMYQMAVTEEFKMYDYGVIKNLNKYRQIKPPIYNITNVPIPVSMWLGPNDWISTVETCRKINNLLQPSRRCKVNLIEWKNWAHLDVLTAKDVNSLLFKDFLPELEKLASGTCTVS